MTRFGVRLVAPAIVFLVCLPAGVPAAVAVAPDVASPASSSPYIVEFTSGTDPDVGAAHLLELGADVSDVYRSVFAGAAIQADPTVIDLLHGDPMVARVAVDQVFTLDAGETLAQAPIVQFGPPWGLDRIDQRFLPPSNSYSYTDSGQGVTAYIVDSGIYLQHNEFGGRARFGFANAVDTSGVGDCNGHGTHVAGIVGGATYGVAKHVSLVAVRVLDCNGSAMFSQIIDALEWVIGDHPAGSPAVVNMSIGGHASMSDAAMINDAVQSTVDDGITVVIAAGNAPQNGPPEDSCDVSPAQAPAAITVAASAQNDSRASFSDFGPCVDLFAPGVGITSAFAESSPSPTDTRVLSGTSMAAPHVTGAVAVLLSRRPTWTPAQVARDLLASATPNVISDPMGSPNKLLFSPPSNPPSNDQFAAATAFDVATTTSFSGTNVDATIEPGEPAHSSVSGGASVWWKFVAPEFGTVTMSTAGSTFDTILAVYAGSSIGALSRLATDVGPGNTSNVSVHVQRGQTYYVAVDGAAGLQGSISLHATWTPAEFVPVVPGRLLETRSGPGAVTVDGLFGGVGVRGAGSVTELVVAGRGGVAADASAVALTVTVTQPVAAGFVTVFPCGSPQPLTSNVNFVAGSTVANSVVSGVGAGGRVCLFTMAETHLVVDVDGYFPAGSSFVSLVPGRLLETRSGAGFSTVDGSFAGLGVRGAGSVTELAVAGRGGVSANASAVVLTVTVTQPVAAGFVTVFPCGSLQPFTSNVNFVAGSTVANSVVSGVGAGGRVCLFTMAATHLVVDVDGYFPAGSSFVSLVPGRLLETRSGPGAVTVDGLFGGVGVRGAGSVTELVVAGRGGVAADASAVVLTVTVTQPVAAGFVTVFPCGSPQPFTSNVNFVAGSTVANSVVSGVGAGGRVCLFTMAETHLVVDVDGFVP